MKGFIEKAVGIRINGGNSCDIQVLDKRFYRDITLRGAMGLGDSYVKGYWDVADLYELQVKILTAPLIRHWTGSIWPSDIYTFLKEKSPFTSRKKAKGNIAFHYNLGNDFYATMLGKTMQYTCAYFDDPNMDLDAAQEQKFALVAKKLQVFPGCHILEIGCGWGVFARYLAETHGCIVTAITLSSEQYQYCMEQSHARHNGSVDFILADFRDTKKYIKAGQKFDRIAGIGTIAHFAPMFKKLVQIISKNLKGGGLALLDDVCRDVTCKPFVPSQSGWTAKYIFPGTQLFSPDKLSKFFKNRLIIEQWHSDRTQYRDTCLAWLANVEDNWDTLRTNSLCDERFLRIWRYYLCGAAAGFESGFLGQWQILLSRMDSPYRSSPRLRRQSNSL